MLLSHTCPEAGYGAAECQRPTPSPGPMPGRGGAMCPSGAVCVESGVGKSAVSLPPLSSPPRVPLCQVTGQRDHGIWGLSSEKVSRRCI